MKTWIVFLLAIITNSVSGQWSVESRELINNFEYPFKNSYVGTVWSSCRAKKYKLEELNATFHPVMVKNSYYNLPEIPVRFFKTKSKSKGTIVFVTGIFGNYSGGLSTQILKEYLDDGMNILSLGNPLGSRNIEKLPKYVPGDLIVEGRAFYESTRLAIIELKKLGFDLGKINVLGVSYGGLTASIMTAIDQGKIFNGKLALLSPPLEMSYALMQMDSLIDDVRDYHHLSKWRLQAISARFCYFPVKRKPSFAQLQRAKASFTILGFQRPLVKAVKLGSRLLNIGKLPTRRNWENSFTFKEFFSIVPELGPLYYGEKDRLFYWLKQSKIPYQVFTSLDDPLNEDLSWPPGEYLLSLEMGGHYGLRNFDIFPKLLKSVF